MLTPLLRVLPVGRASSQMLYDPSVDPLWPEIKVRCRLRVLRRSPLLAWAGMRSGHPLPTKAHSRDGRRWRPHARCALRAALEWAAAARLALHCALRAAASAVDICCAVLTDSLSLPPALRRNPDAPG